MTKINRILLFGTTGMLGSYIAKYFCREDSDIELVNIEFRVTRDNLPNLERVLIEHLIGDNSCIINCIGAIPQRFSGKPDADYYLVNSIFPQLLSSICQRYNAKMIQPTTDCVFSGNREVGSYRESDRHDETNHYGMSKSLGEPANCTVIRTSIIGREIHNKQSFLEWVLSNDQCISSSVGDTPALLSNITGLKRPSVLSSNSGKEISGWNNHYWNGITCLEYCKIIRRIIDENMFWCGVRHVFSPTPVSKYELARMIISVFSEEDRIRVLNVECETAANKTLDTEYKRLFEIGEIYDQIKELKNTDLPQ